MRLVTWNVNGIKSVIKNGFDDFLADYDPDICCLQETKMDYETIRFLEYRYSNYNTYWQIGEKKGYGGVGILVKKNLEIVKIQKGLSIEFPDKEARLITLYLNDLIIVNSYFIRKFNAQSFLNLND